MLHALSPASQATPLGKTFVPGLISSQFMSGMRAVFYVSAVLCLIAAAASLMRGRQVTYGQETASAQDVESSATAADARASVSASDLTEPDLPEIEPTATVWSDDESPTGALTREGN